MKTLSMFLATVLLTTSTLAPVTACAAAADVAPGDAQYLLSRYESMYEVANNPLASQLDRVIARAWIVGERSAMLDAATSLEKQARPARNLGWGLIGLCAVAFVAAAIVTGPVAVIGLSALSGGSLIAGMQLTDKGGNLARIAADIRAMVARGDQLKLEDAFAGSNASRNSTLGGGVIDLPAGAVQPNAGFAH